MNDYKKTRKGFEISLQDLNRDELIDVITKTSIILHSSMSFIEHKKLTEEFLSDFACDIWLSTYDMILRAIDTILKNTIEVD